MGSRLTELVAPLEQREARRLFGAQLVSGLGDWAGRLALAVVVFDRSGSAWWTAAVTLVALLPWLGPGQLLSTLADRFGRVRVMVTADLARAALFVVMAVPMPTGVLLGLAFAAGLCVPPFVSARGAALVDVVPAERYGRTLALFGVANQAELVLGYALGGVAIAAIGPRPTLLLNAVTFLLSAAFVASIARSAAGERRETGSVGWAGVRDGAAFWRADPFGRRALALFVGVNMVMVLPEALVVPYADELGASTGAVGVLAASIAAGSMIAMVVTPTGHDPGDLLRRAARRTALYAVAATIGFALSADALPVAGVAALLLTGAVDAVAVPTNQVVGTRLPRDNRAAAMSVAGGVQYGAQTVAIAIGGLAAELASSTSVLVVASLTTVAVCCWAWQRPITVGD